MKYFQPHEFQCQCYKCGLGFDDMDEDFLEMLGMARLYAKYPFRLTSAVRCEEHNRNVRGREDSAHLKGAAVDISTPSSHARQRVLYGLIKAGFHRFGIYEKYIHVDNDRSKPAEVVWITS